MIAVFAAMTLEMARFGRRLANRERAPVGGYLVQRGDYKGRPVLLCRTGIGRRAETAVRVVLDRYPGSRAVLSVGIGGALNPDLNVGDLVACQSVECAPSSESDPAPIPSDEGLLRLACASAEEAGLRAWPSRFLTVDRVVGDPAEKDALRRSSGLDVVEMESYWVGLVAQERGLPFLAARVISDGVGDAVPDIPGIVTLEGEQQMRKVFPYVLRHPASVPLLLRLALSGQRATANLTRWLESFVSACGAPARAESEALGGQS